MSVNPTDVLAQRHKAYRQAQERYQRATAAREAAQQRVAELESELAAAEGRDRVALGDALVDGRRPSKPEAHSVRPRLDEAKREAEALAYAEQRAGVALDRLPREHKDEWLRAATRSLDKARAAYSEAIGELARARDQLSDEAVLVSFLQNDGQYTQPLTGAIQRPGADGTNPAIGFVELTELMLKEAASVEEKALLDPNRPMPEPQFHLASGGGSKRLER
jgi:hypothetical protein